MTDLNRVNTVRIALPVIRRNTSPTPIGLTSGDLSKGINQHATNPSMLLGLLVPPNITFEPIML